MNEALPARGLAIAEPPVSPVCRPLAAVAAPAVTPAAEGPRRFDQPNAPTATVQVTLRLSSGERIPVETFDTPESAKQHAQVLTHEIGSAREWLFLSGRFVRPDAVVSVDLDTVR
jgi:hypothetical protein